MQNFFYEAISKKKVRNGVFAYQYPNGCVNIEGEKYFGYSMTAAISLWRKKFPKNK